MVQSSLSDVAPEPPATVDDFAPFWQLARMLVPSAGSFAIYDAAGELAWCSDGYERPDLRALVEGLPRDGRGAEPAIRPTEAGVPAFVAPLTGHDGERLGCAVLELGRSQAARQVSSMIASLLKPVLECLEGRLNLERTVAGQIAAGFAHSEMSAAESAGAHAVDSLEQLLRQSVQSLAGHYGALLAPEKGIRLVHAAEGAGGASMRSIDAIEKHLLAWMRQSGRPMIMNRVAPQQQQQTELRKVLACPLRDASSRVIGLLGVFRDAAGADFQPSDMPALERAAQRAVVLLGREHDPLTGFVNRLAFERCVGRELGSVAGAGHALAYFDVDRLQLVNDAFGYQAGDEVIQRVAAAIRAEATTEDVLGRVGGDRFAAFLPRRSPEAAAEIGRRILARLAGERASDSADSVPLSVCVGVAGVDSGESRVGHLLAAAELACKRAKRFGRGRVQLAGTSDRQSEAYRDRALAASQLHDALRNGGLCLLGQPIIRLAAGSAAPIGCEVLLRMRSDGELLAPEKFFDAAEREQLLGALDRWVLATLGDRFGSYAAALEACGLQLRLNVSAHSVADAGFASFALQRLEHAGLPPHLVCFEVRETLALHRRQAVAAFAATLIGAGSALALDNCDTALRSLGPLRDLGITEIKIDGGLIRRIDSDPDAESLVASAGATARSLGLRTIAQHVESAAVAERLRALGIDCGQGFALGRPVPLEELLAAAVGAPLHG